jgi:asparagine synthase (glutamine-hydrolysing)
MQGVTVAISGTGGDELFAGYPWFISMAMNQHRNQQEPWKTVVKSLIALLARQPVFDAFMLIPHKSSLYRARNCAGFLTKYALNYQIFGAIGADSLLSSSLKKPAQAGRSPHYDLRCIDDLRKGTVIERVTSLCLRGYTNNQLLRDIDVVSMAHSLEVRVPYLDPLVVDTALSLPDNAKLGNVINIPFPEQGTYRETGAKRILIDAERTLLPNDIDLQPKRGFGMPFGTWLKGPLREVLLDTLSEDQVRKRGLLNVQEAMTVKKRFLEGQLDWAQPWLLMMFELWCREVLEKSYQHPIISDHTIVDKKRGVDEN